MPGKWAFARLVKRVLMAVELYYEIDLSSCFCTRTNALFLGKQILLQILILYITFLVTFLGPQNPGPPMCNRLFKITGPKSKQYREGKSLASR